MHIADNPAIVHVAHNVFNRGESPFSTRVETHGQPDTGQQLIDQYNQRQDAKEIPEIKVFRGIVLAHVGIPGAHNWQSRINPVPQSNKHICHDEASVSTPITRISLPS